MQDNESIMCGFYCIALTEYTLAGKTLLDSTSSNKKGMKRMKKQYVGILKINMAEGASLEFKLTLKWLEKINLISACSFSNNVAPKRRVRPCFL